MVDSKIGLVVSTWLLHSLIYFTLLIVLNIYFTFATKDIPIPIEMIVIFSLIMGGIGATVVSRK